MPGKQAKFLSSSDVHDLLTYASATRFSAAAGATPSRIANTLHATFDAMQVTRTSLAPLPQELQIYQYATF